MPATYMSRSCSFRERQKSRTPRTLGYFYPLILSVRQFDDSRAFAQGLVARYICPIFNCSLCYYFLLMLLTLVDSRTNLAKSTVEALRENFGNQIKMYRTYIPIAVKAAETSSKGKSIFAYEPNSTVSKAYTEFTKEVLADGRKKERLHSHEAR